MLFLFVFATLLFIVLLISLFRVPSQHVRVLEWTIPFILRPALRDHVVARPGEQGIEARHHMPGWNIRLFANFFAKWHDFPFIAIPDDHIMIVAAADGEEKPPGQVFANAIDRACLSDGERFLREDGQRGPQRWIFGPGGTCAFNQVLFKHELVKRTDFFPKEIDDPIKPGKLSIPTFGLVTALVGEEISEGRGQRLLGQPVRGHNNFQDVGAFLEGDGTWAIATRRPMKGQRGPQQEIIEAAAFLHPLAFRAEPHPATVIPEGFLGVRISNVGDAPADPNDFLPPNDARFKFKTSENGIETEHERRWVRVLRPEAVADKRGVRPDPYHPGTRFVSPWVERVVLVDTTEVKVCFDKHTENTRHPEAIRGPLHQVITSEGFQVTLHMELVIQVHSDLAPMLVGLSGGLTQSIRDFIAPTAERVARVIASQTSIGIFISERDTYGKEVEKNLRVQLGIRYLDLVSFNVTDIEYLDAEVRERLRATTQMDTLEARKATETKRAEVEKLKGKADAAAQVEIITATAGARKGALDTLLPSGGFLRNLAGAALADPDGLSTVIHGNGGKKKKKVTTVEETEE